MSSSSASNASASQITSIRPMLAVTDAQRTIRFYCEKLGFACVDTFGDPPRWCALRRDGQEMMFNSPPPECIRRDVPRPSKNYQIFYFNSDDVVALRDEFKSRGVAVSDLRVTVYGMKEFEVRDPDDYWLWFGQPTDEPPTVTE
jgi:catechol 2,3-dioxygenase-like lactoylglutathione lyase family enzyme